jgi:hypothetical protein
MYARLHALTDLHLTLRHQTIDRRADHGAVEIELGGVARRLTRQLVDSAARGDADAIDLLMLLDQYAKKGGGHSPIIVEIVPDEPNPEK